MRRRHDCGAGHQDGWKESRLGIRGGHPKLAVAWRRHGTDAIGLEVGVVPLVAWREMIGSSEAQAVASSAMIGEKHRVESAAILAVASCKSNLRSQQLVSCVLTPG